MLVFYQRDLHYLFFRYIDRAVVLPDVWISFAEFLKDPSFLWISGIDVDASPYDNVGSILKDLQTKSRSNGADSRFLRSVELIVRDEEFIENGEFVSVYHFYLLYNIFLLTVHYLYLLYNILSFNDGIYYVGKWCKRIRLYWYIGKRINLVKGSSVRGSR